MKKEEQILWYWSGEADDGLSCEIEELLEDDPGAREYFDELGKLALALTEEKVPERREGLLDEVLETRLERNRVPAFAVYAMVATIMVSGFSVLLVLRGPDVTPPSETGARDGTSDSMVPLSERLLSDSGSFRARDGGLERNNRQRRRWKNIRNPKRTI